MSSLTFASVRMPLAATMPNSAMPAPPSTARGTPSTSADTLGSRPRTTRIAPAAVATKRDRTPVSETSPTFCAKAVYGKVLKTPPMTVPRPSARRPSATWRRVTGLSTISPTAIMSPVVSVMMTMPTMSIDTIGTISKVGRPKWNGVTSPNHAASPTPDESVIPGTNAATAVPITRPSSTETRARPRGAKRSMRMMSSRVPPAKASERPDPEPSSLPVTIQPAATLMSDRPMMRITLPVTMGGKNRSSCAKNGAMRIMNSPHAIVAPNTAVMG